MEIIGRMLKESYFSWIVALLKACPEAEVFLVGGAVRDAILDRQIKDYDFVVRGVQARHLQEFLGKVGIVNFVGRNFGVYKFIPEQGYAEFKATGLESFDVALPRTEHAWGTGGYRDVEVQSNHELPIEEDLERRDFTINAIALRLNFQFSISNFQTISNSQFPISKLDLIDPFDGVGAIQAKIIRAVGNPTERFKEDYTRMLRALRFACELDFTIEKDTLVALQNVMPAINDLRAGHDFVAPREVVAAEFLRAFFTNPVKAFDLYDQSGAFEQLIPELLKMKGCPQPEEFHSEGDVWSHTRLALEQIGSPEFKKLFPNAQPSVLLIIAVLLHDLGKPPMLKTPAEDGVDRIRFDEHDTVGAGLAKEIAQRLKFSIMPEHGPRHIDCDKLSWLIKHHLLLLHTKAEEFKAATVEKYFFDDRVPGVELLQLIFCDAVATVPRGGTPDLQNIFDMQARIKRMTGMTRGRKGLPKPLLNGDEIMKILQIPPGPGVGEIIGELREEQLSVRVTNKEEAIAFIKERFD